MPLVIFDLPATQKTNRVVSPRCPKRKPGCSGKPLYDRGISCFLKNNQIGCRSGDRFRKRVFSAVSTKADVVT
jgi:hypothetical protein